MNCVYKWCVDRIPPEDLEEWLFSLNQPLPGSGKKKATPTQVDDDGQGFMALMAEMSG